jgi:hypothetical protein
MRGAREQPRKSMPPPLPSAAPEVVQLLHGIRDELRATRELLAQRKG